MVNGRGEQHTAFKRALALQRMGFGHPVLLMGPLPVGANEQGLIACFCDQVWPVGVVGLPDRYRQALVSVDGFNEGGWQLIVADWRKQSRSLGVYGPLLVSG